MTEKKWCVLVVDDEITNLDIVETILIDDYQVVTAVDGFEALKKAEDTKPDLILLDIMMPKMNGYETCRKLKSNPATARIPVIFFSARSDEDSQMTGFDVGGVDFIGKPISPSILEARVSTHLKLADQQKASENLVQQRTRDLKKSQRAAIFMLGEAGHYNDTDTGVHIWRMGAFSAAIAREAGWHVDDATMLEMAAPMHDTGKIGTPDEILKKPGPLNESEWQIMRTHPAIGFHILSKSDTPLFKMAADIALSHHEKWDGSGYPQGLTNEKIPESARIVAVADVFDALTMKRPYKEAWPEEKAIAEIRRSAGNHFDPRLVDCFLSIQSEILYLKAEWNRRESDLDPVEYFDNFYCPAAEDR